MEKTKEYKNALFDADVIKKALSARFPDNDNASAYYRLKRGNETWDYDKDQEQEFFADYRKEHYTSTLRKYNQDYEFQVRYHQYHDQTVSVKAQTRGEIEEIFEIFEQKYGSSIIEPPKDEKKGPVIFIGHGRSSHWRDLKDHLTDKHGYKIEAYETGARAGHTIRDILEEMASKSSLALLVMTGEDSGEDGSVRARQNVVHEVGLFQGHLGFSKAIVLLEEEAEEFSNLNGIQQIRFSKDNIKETFGEVLATIKREFEK
jgi:hypothetical protein